jgi:hypothetical protein
MRFPISYSNSGASYFLSKILQVMGLATIVVAPICFASPAHADDFYRSNRQSNHWNGFPVRGRVIISFPSQQQTTESTRIIQFDRFGSRDDRFFSRKYNNGYSEHNRFGDDRYNNDRYNNNWYNNDRYNNDRYNNDRNVQVIRSYNDRDSDQGLLLQIQPKDRPFFSVGHQVGTTETLRFPVVYR